MNPKARSVNFLHPSRWSNTVWVLLLALLASLPYLNTLLNGFVYDDLAQVMDNPYILSFHYLPRIFGSGVWSYIGKQGASNYYRPLMTFGYLLCYQAFGKVAYGYHLVNLLLHAGVVCVLFGVTLALFRRRDVALVAALIFALHPVHSESVAWIAAVTDLELTFFYLLTFWLFVGLVRTDGRRSGRAFLGMVFCFILALLSKEQALTLPLLAMIYEHGYREDRFTTAWTEKLSRYGALWLLVGAYLLLRIRLLGALAPVNQMPAMTWPQAFFSALALTGQYAAKLFWPVTLCAFYVFHKSARLLEPGVISGLVVMAVLIAAWAGLWKRARVASFGVIWFFATLAPVLNARWMAANVFAERYLYLPSAGFCWVLAWCAVKIWEGARSSRRARLSWAGCFAILLVLGAARITTRNHDWNNDVRLYTRTLAQQPDAYQIRNNLGTVYWRQEKVKAAKREWIEALKLHPQNAIVLNNLGLVYDKEKKPAKAVNYFKRAMRLKPAYTDPHLNLGIVYAEMGLQPEAKLQLQAATELAPLNVPAHNELGSLYLEAGEDASAARQFRASIQSEANTTALDGLGKIEARWGRLSDAERAFRDALLLNPFDSVAHFGLGAIDAATDRNSEAQREYQSGLQTDPKNPEALAALRKLKSHDGLVEK